MSKPRGKPEPFPEPPVALSDLRAGDPPEDMLPLAEHRRVIDARNAARPACKHGLGDCSKCGTTSTRDRIHTTKGGKGSVARIKR